ncbi:polysaccharide deacetylase family protein [Rhizobium sp. CRIBSB]|nr:polysaccharide deacetylase family protein [Rhizobium sp. CRIBSB]
MDAPAYTADASLMGKLRRRFARVTHRAPLRLRLERPVVSFTFDDAPESAATAGAEVLESHGVRGTYYVCTGLFGQDGRMGRFADAEQVKALAERGHEIACHTSGHLDCHRTPDAPLLADCDTNVRGLKALGGSGEHFAFPYGEVSPHAKALLAPHYGSLRGVQAGLVHNGSDRNQLPAIGIEGEDGEARARRWVDRAVKAQGDGRSAWLILFTHDVRDAPSSWGCTPAALDRLAAHARAAGCDIRTVGQVLA